MPSSKELPTIELDIMNPFVDSLKTERLRQVVFGRTYGPAGIKFYRGIRDGSVSISDLPQFAYGRDGINAHFLRTIESRYCGFGDMQPEELYTDLQEVGIRVVRRLATRALPRQASRLWQLKNELLSKAPNPTTLFKLLALPEDQVDRRAAFEAARQLLIMSSAAPLFVRSRDYNVGQKVADWIDIFNEELFEGPYAAGEEYRLQVYHNDQTNEVIRFHTGDRDPKPPKQGERLATHHFTARRVKDYGLVFVDVSEEDVPDATIRALTKAAHNGNAIQPTTDVKGGMTMTFVDLEDNRRRVSNNTPHMTALKARVMGVMLRHMQIGSMSIPPDETQEQTNSRFNKIELSQQGLDLPIRVEFWKGIDYLNSRYHVGVRQPVNGIPEPVHNGQAQELSDLREYYPLVSHLFPKGVFGIDPQEALLMTIEEKAAQLKAACTDQVTYLNADDIKAMVN